MAALNEIFDDARRQLTQRLSRNRLLHSVSTAKTAVALAELYAVDTEYARIAGMLHDWDKKYSDAELLERARELGLASTEVGDFALPVIHAQTGALALARQYPDLPPEIIQAIARHTAAAIDMSDLDMVIYVADMLEPLRARPELAELRSLVGKVSLRELFAACFRTTFAYLQSSQAQLDPTTLAIFAALAEG